MKEYKIQLECLWGDDGYMMFIAWSDENYVESDYIHITNFDVGLARNLFYENLQVETGKFISFYLHLYNKRKIEDQKYEIEVSATLLNNINGVTYPLNYYSLDDNVYSLIISPGEGHFTKEMTLLPRDPSTSGSNIAVLANFNWLFKYSESETDLSSIEFFCNNSIIQFNLGDGIYTVVLAPGINYTFKIEHDSTNGGTTILKPVSDNQRTITKELIIPYGITTGPGLNHNGSVTKLLILTTPDVDQDQQLSGGFTNDVEKQYIIVLDMRDISSRFMITQSSIKHLNA